MKAPVIQELSGPSGLVYTDVDNVKSGGDVVVIDVRAAGVCFPDLLLSKGEYQLKLPPPFVPGMEAAGVVRSAPGIRIPCGGFWRSGCSAVMRSKWPYRWPT